MCDVIQAACEEFLEVIPDEELRTNTLARKTVWEMRRLLEELLDESFPITRRELRNE